MELSRLFEQQRVESLDVANLVDLRRATVVDLASAMRLLAYLLLARAFWDSRLDTLPVPALLAAGAWAALQMRHGRLRAARYTLVVALVLATAYETWLFPGGMVRYGLPLVVVACSLLVSHAGVFAVATLAALGYLAAVAGRAGWVFGGQDLSQIVLLYVAALAAWVGSRQHYVALGWMENSYRRAQSALDELRERRATLARTVKGLEEAYRRIERMNDALIEARAVADEARRLKAEFAANISHELRTPLSLIIGFSETMANAPETYGEFVWAPRLRGDVERIYRASRHLSALVDDILDLSALEVRRMGFVIEEVSISDVIMETVSVVNDLFRAKDLYLRVELEPDLPRLRIDPTRIRQVLLNLLNNASRFTTIGGVTVGVRLVRGEVEISVADSGVGIAPRDVPKVFEEFRQVDGSTRREHGGTGLGVPLSKRLVELHGGRMWLDSTPGKGTTFRFTLPVLARVTAVAEERPREPTADARRDVPYRRALLVAEPDPILVRMLRRHLSGYEVLEVQKQEEALALAEHYVPSALLVDSQAGDPFSALQAWGAAVPPGVPVIGFGMRGAVAEARAMGASGYLVKPLVREQLLDSLAQLPHRVQTVLVADDDPEFVELVCRLLQSAARGYHPVKVLGGEEALARMQRQRPDAVLLDLGMPEVDGATVLRAMRRDLALADVPVIVISAREYPEAGGPAGGHALGLTRREGFTVAELLSCLQALLAALPAPALPAHYSPGTR